MTKSKRVRSKTELAKMAGAIVACLALLWIAGGCATADGHGDHGYRQSGSSCH